MVSGKGYKGGRSRGISTKTSDPPLPTPNNIENWAKCRWKRILYRCNIAGRMEGWTQFKPNDKLSLRAEYIPRNLDASVFLQCSMFFAPYTDQQIVSLCDENFSSFRFDSSKSNHTAWHWRRRRLKSTCLILRHKTPIDLIWREYYNPVSQELAVWKKIISMSFSPLSFFLSAMLDC